MAARTLKSPENYIKTSKNVCQSRYGAYVDLGREDKSTRPGLEELRK